MPELRVLKPKEAFEVVCAAKQIEREATFWDQMSVRSVVWTFGSLAMLGVIVGVVVLSKYKDLFVAGFVLILPFAMAGAFFSGRRALSRKLRPRIHDVLKARQASATGAR